MQIKHIAETSKEKLGEEISRHIADGWELYIVFGVIHSAAHDCLFYRAMLTIG